MEFNSVSPPSKERPLKAGLNHCSDSRNFKEPMTRISTDSQLWNYSRILSLDASRLSSRIMARTRAPSNVGGFAFPARQGAKRENRIRSAPRAIRQRRRRRVFVASRSIAFGEFDVGPSDQQLPEACTRRQPPLLRQQLPRCDRARLASQDHDEQGGYNKQRHAQAGDHEDRHLCIQPLDSQGPKQTLE